MVNHSSIAWRTPLVRGPWWVTVPRVTKSQTQLSMHALRLPHHPSTSPPSPDLKKDHGQSFLSL